MEHKELWPKQQPITWEIRGSLQGLQGRWLCPFCRQTGPWQIQDKADFTNFTSQLINDGKNNHWNLVSKP